MLVRWSPVIPGDIGGQQVTAPVVRGVTGSNNLTGFEVHKLKILVQRLADEMMIIIEQNGAPGISVFASSVITLSTTDDGIIGIGKGNLVKC